MHIAKKLGAQVCFGCDRIKVGQGSGEGWHLMKKHHLVFSLVPTARAYSKLDEDFGKLRKSEIGTMQIQGDFGGNSAVRKVAQTNNKDVE